MTSERCSGDRSRRVHNSARRSTLCLSQERLFTDSIRSEPSASAIPALYLPPENPRVKFVVKNSKKTVDWIFRLCYNLYVYTAGKLIFYYMITPRRKARFASHCRQTTDASLPETAEWYHRSPKRRDTSDIFRIPAGRYRVLV